MVAITEIVIVILDGSRRFRQCTVADVVHLLGDFTRWTQCSVSRANAITNIVVIARAIAVVARISITFISISVINAFGPLTTAIILTMSAARVATLRVISRR